jgi:hypothetical protein
MVVHNPDGIQSFFACKMTSGPIPSPDNTAILNSWELLLVIKITFYFTCFDDLVYIVINFFLYLQILKTQGNGV